MSAYSELAAIVTRIASLSSVLRTRQADDCRVDHNGGTRPEFEDQIRQVAGQFRQALEQLEDALA